MLQPKPSTLNIGWILFIVAQLAVALLLFATALILGVIYLVSVSLNDPNIAAFLAATVTCLGSLLASIVGVLPGIVSVAWKLFKRNHGET